MCIQCLNKGKYPFLTTSITGLMGGWVLGREGREGGRGNVGEEDGQGREGGRKEGMYIFALPSMLSGDP